MCARLDKANAYVRRENARSECRDMISRRGELLKRVEDRVVRQLNAVPDSI